MAFNDLRKFEEAILPLKECLKINPKAISANISFSWKLYMIKLNQEKISENYYNQLLKFNSKNCNSLL